ncbi:unnamed protein product [Closterium sp. NIES-54]
MPVAKKSDVLREFQKWLVLVERQAKKSVLMVRSDRGGEFLRKEFTDFVNGKGIVHDLTCPYTLQQNGMAEREMWTAVESFMVPEKQCGGKLAPKARWGLHLGVSPESKGWDVLDLTDNKMVTSVEVIFYKTLSLEVWKANFGPALGRTQAHLPTDTSTTTIPLLAKVDEPADEDVVEVLPPPLVLDPPSPVAYWPALTPVSATGNEGSLEGSPVAPASGIAGVRQGAKLVDQDGKPSTTGEQQTGEPVEQEASAGVQSTREQQTGWLTGELSKSAGGEQLVEGSKQLVDDEDVDKEGELGRARRPPERLSFHTCLPPAAFTTVYDEVDDDLLYDDAEEYEELPELDLYVHADPEHRWDIATMMVKEALASWKGEAVKAAMEEEIRGLVGMGTWELVELPRGLNIMKNRYITLRIFLSILAVLDLHLMQLDMKNSFLQSKLDQVLYMYHSDYFDDGTSQSQVNEALYFKADNDGVTCWVLVYVDDLLAASSSTAMLKELLEANFELREILPVVKYLGLEIVRDRPATKLWLHQQGYVNNLRMCFIDEEQGGRVPNTPVSVDAYAELTFDDEEAQEREEEEYRQKVGSQKVGGDDEARHRVRLQQAGERPHESLELIGYVDADDAGDKQNRTSTSGYVFVFGGAAVSWSSQRIKCATLSSTESEYVAATDASKDGRRLRLLLAKFKLLDAGKPTILRVDNKSAITVAEGLGLTGNLKHMERRYAWLQHMVRHVKFVLKYIPTTEQPADFLTKALHFPAFNRCSVAIGQVRLADVGDGDDDVQH